MEDLKITRLSGPERVRKRPAVIFLSDGIAGVQYAVCSLLKIFVTEAQLGYCKQLNVRQNGENLEISGDDRGIYLGQDTENDEIWQSIFTRLDPAPAYPPETVEDAYDAVDEDHYVLYGDKTGTDGFFGHLELYALQCASKFMKVRVNRNGICSALAFRQGVNIGGISHCPTTEQNGTCFRFAPDPEVFTQVLIPEEFFRERLETFAIQVPGLSCTYENADGVKITYCYPEGAQSYIAEKHPGSVYRTKMWAKGRERYNSAEYKAHVELAVGYTPQAGAVRCYHNFDVLAGGSHLEQLQKKICSAFNICFGTEISDITPSELQKHLTVVLSTRCKPLFTVWRNGCRNAIENRLITDMAQDAIDEAFDRYLHETKDLYRDMIKAILAERKAK